MTVYFQEKRPRKEYSIRKLKTDKINVFNKNEELLDKWSVYNCIISELEFDKKYYVLSLGQWYKIDENFITKINKDIENITTCALEIIDYNQENEGEYNKDAAEQSYDLLCMDQANVLIDNGKFEFCDLLSAHKHIIHVKRWSSSATLSHLFAQGRISAEIMNHSPKKLSDINKKIKDRGGDERYYLNTEQINPQDYTIVYAIIYEGDKSIEDRIPFFSKLNFMHSVKILKNMQFKVEKMHIINKRNNEF